MLVTKLQDARLKRGMTQKQLAEQAGINFRMLQNYEQGVKLIDNARLETILKICLVLNCKMGEVIEQDSLLRLLGDYKGGDV